MKKIILFLFLLSFNIIKAQLNFSKKSIMENVNATEGVTSIHSVDIDGDGDKDLLSGDAYKVKWFENVGGNNSQMISHTIGDIGVSYCSFADIDRDGDFDVIVQSYFQIHWIENTNGRGNFALPKLLFSSDRIHHIFITDFDLDNDLDILYSYTNWNYSGLSWLENTTGNVFNNRTISQYSRSRAIYAIDIDRDNDVDIFSLNYDTQKIELFSNNGSLNFTTQVITNGRDNGYGTMNFSDIDNDNDQDLIVSNSAGYTTSIEEINIFKNNGTGNLTLFRTLVTNGIGLSNLLTKDLDNDNDLDIVVSCYNDDKVSWFKNNDGLGNFSNISVINDKLNGAKAVCAYDYDGDNDIDVLSASQIEDKIVLHENLNGVASFGPEKILTRSINNPKKSITADIDGDGIKDVLSISYNDAKLAWYKNLDGRGNFGLQNLISADLYSLGDVAAVDLDQDGDLDVISGENHSSQSVFVWYENLDGRGRFSAQRLIAINRGLFGIATGDLDNDGDNDFVITGGSVENSLTWYKNLGQGNFAMQSIPTPDISVFGDQLYIKDINSDGKNDIVILAGATVSWYANDGSGNFTQKTFVGSFYDGHSLSIEDLDGDGDLDFVLAHEATFDGNNRVVWYENLDGNGNFGPVIVIDSRIPSSSFGGYSIEIQAKDLDSDGDVDIVGRSDHNSNIVWYENLDGKGTFTQQVILFTETGFDINSMFLDDIDSDGYTDILTSIVNDNYLNTVKTDKITYFKNLGPAFNKINGFVRAGLNVDDCNIPVNNLKVTTNNGTDTISTFTTKTGYFQYYVDPGNYTTTIPSTLRNFNISAPVSHNSLFVGIGNIDVANFCLYPSEIVNDLNVVLVPLNQPRPGFETSYQIVFNNVGNTRLNGKITLVFDDSKLTFNSASITPNAITNNSLTFDFVNLNPFETRTINLSFSIAAPPTVEINDSLVYSLSIDSQNEDSTPDDNLYILNQVVIGSFDPNDITCLEGESITIDQAKNELHYLIRFQNKGTASAINVRIENTLEDKLDWETFQLINSSHNNRVEIKNGNKVSFFFDKINLPHEAENEPASHGFVAYKIKPKDNVVIGDVFQNKADIFFDFNLPVVTNTALTEIKKRNSNNNHQFNLYPSPVIDILKIRSKTEIVKIEIFNELGQLVLSNSNQNFIYVTNLSSGLYICKATDKNNISEAQKIIKN
ncbi:T9SS type A sorting domain-containing protein [Flavobacterium sp. GCM10027622]|uniref:T9SS type A sorting domain-containing protein n=1 Tax=unclassified Flavobacterium TaxID=196869 RepID=UPI00360DC086